MTADPSTSAPAVRIYDQLRSAHLERLAHMAPASMWYADTRADFDPSLVDPHAPPRHKRRRWMLVELARRHHRVIEVNEPAMPEQWPFLLMLCIVVRIRSLISRRRTLIVTYCIENADPVAKAARRWRLPNRLARPVTRWTMGLLLHATSRIAFGTSGARDTYLATVGSRAWVDRSRTFEALPAACDCGALDADRPDQVLFVGSFVPRKGIEELMSSWGEFHRREPTTRLTLIGTGRLLPEVRTWAQGRVEVELIVDPPRRVVHEELRRARVLVLLSQPVAGWREQIGLPILEGLAHGCEIVTTTETGLADWLRHHDHEVNPASAAPSAVASSISAALDRSRRRHGSLSELPAVDQRLAADWWLMSDVASGEGGARRQRSPRRPGRRSQ